MALDDASGEEFSVAAEGYNAVMKKRILIVLAIILVFCAFIFALYQAAYKKENSKDLPYRVIEKEGDAPVSLVLYSLPDIKTTLAPEKSGAQKPEIEIEVAFEFLDKEQIDNFEALSPKVMDALVFMFSNVKASEIVTPKGMYWLKEEILHRTNLLVAPIKIESVSYKKFKLKGAYDEEAALSEED